MSIHLSTLLHRLAPILALLVSTALPAQAQSLQLVWADEFDGTSLDTSQWEYQIGTGCPSLCGWGNSELQYYRSQNVTVSGGTLRITAQAQNFAGSNYTSGRIRTRGDMGIDWTYGRIEARAKLPKTQGLWPAIWMLPTDFVYGGWAASGEIDIMELVGDQPNRVYGTIHYGSPSPGNVFTGNTYTLPSGDFSDDFHVFSIEWEPNQIRWYVDGILYASQSSWWSSGGAYPAPFNQNFHMLLNVAVGGNFPGNPDGSTQFPQTMEVDYVRVYQEGDPPCTIEHDDMEHGDPFANGWSTFGGPNGGGTIFAVPGDVPPLDGGTTSLGASYVSSGMPGYQGGFEYAERQNLENATHFEFWISADAGVEGTLSVNLQEDDNGDNIIPNPPVGDDDEFQALLSIGGPGSAIEAGGGWQHVILPFTDFADDNSYLFGGNGVFDPVPAAAGGNGQLINVVIALDSATGANTSFRTDAWRFTRRDSVISGVVWDDLNGDGQQVFEFGLAGVQLELIDTARGNVLSTAVTDSFGIYSLSGATEGAMHVRIVPSSLPAGATATFDPDGIQSPEVAFFVLDCDESLFSQKFGFNIPSAPELNSFCFGDGGDQAGCTDCPCGNNAPPGTLGGCLNPAGTSARLEPSGNPSTTMDTLRFDMSGAEPSSFGILSSGNSLAPAGMANPCFGLGSGIVSPTLDGLRCAVQGVQRHGTRAIDANGDVGVTTSGWGPPNGPPGGLINQGSFTAGQTRHYQVIYRVLPEQGCLTGQNTTQAVTVTFVP